jgi:Zn-dependent peptidase ImmA (M78 family)
MVWSDWMKTEALARQAAESARYRAGLRSGRVDVFAAIRDLGIRMLRYPLPDSGVEGAYVRRGAHAFILVNSAPYLSRQRFTAAHELGHHFLTPDDDLDHYDEVVDGSADRAANLFAGHFLMDEESVLATVDRVRDPLAAAIGVMQAFDVSLPAAAIHLRDLGVIDEHDKRQIFDEAETASIPALCQRVGAPVPRNAGRNRDDIDPGEEYVAALLREVTRGRLAPEAARDRALGLQVDLPAEDEFAIALPPGR